MECEATPREEIEEATGKLGFKELDDGLMHSVIDNDKKTVDQADFIKESINKGIGAFTPDLLFEQLVDNYSTAKNIYGPSLIRQLTGYDDSYIEKNVGIPEFMADVKKKIHQNLDQLKKDGLVDKNYEFTEKAAELAALSCFVEEIENLVPKGTIGKKYHNKTSHYGVKNDIKTYKKGDRYKDLAMKSTVKAAIRRGHRKLTKGDLRIFTRQSKGRVHVIIAMDSSGSMKGEKIGTCKKAGIALAYRATEEKDKVGLIVFGSDIKESIEPTDDLTLLVKSMVNIRASKETDIAKTIEKATDLFHEKNVTRHLILITDALPTVGEDPTKDTLKAVEIANKSGITISVVGIDIDDKGRDLAEKIIELGKGRLYIVKDLKEMDRIILEDYYRLSA